MWRQKMLLKDLLLNKSIMGKISFVFVLLILTGFTKHKVGTGDKDIEVLIIQKRHC